MLAPLDHASVTLDFKGEVKALVDMLHRAQKGLSMRFDVATTEKLSEMLSLRPTILHLVCHAGQPRLVLVLTLTQRQTLALSLSLSLSLTPTPTPTPTLTLSLTLARHAQRARLP